MYLLDFSAAAQGALLEMIERGALDIIELLPEDLPAIRSATLTREASASSIGWSRGAPDS